MILPKKEILYAPMLSTFGGGSVRGFRSAVGGGGAGTNENYNFNIDSSTEYSYASPTLITASEPTNHTWIGGTVGGYGVDEAVYLVTNDYNKSPSELIDWDNSSPFSKTGWSPSVDQSFWSGLSPIDRPAHVHFYTPTRALVSGMDEGHIMTVTTTTDYDFTTVSSINYKVTSNWFSNKLGETGGGAAFMNSSGTAIVARGYNSGSGWHRVSLSTAHDPSSAGSPTAIRSSTTGSCLAAATLSPDGRYIYALDYGNTEIRKYDAGSGTDIWSVSAGNLSEDVGTGSLYNVTGGSYHNLQIDFKNTAGLNGQVRVYVQQTNVNPERLYISSLDLIP